MITKENRCTNHSCIDCIEDVAYGRDFNVCESCGGELRLIDCSPLLPERFYSPSEALDTYDNSSMEQFKRGK